MDVFQSTLPARGATDRNTLIGIPYNISIHAPRTGSDKQRNPTTNSCISFQSTLPARGATRRGLRAHDSKNNFNPRSPHGERRTCADVD